MRALLDASWFSAQLALRSRADKPLSGRRACFRGVSMDCFEPSSLARGAVVVGHGLNSLGPRDPRIVRIAHIISGQGFVAIVPEHEDLRDHRLDADAIEVHDKRLEAVCDWTGEKFGLRPGLFVASYLASLSLEVLARSPDLQRRVAGVCAVAAFASFSRWETYCLTESSSDVYTRMVIAKNALRATGGLSAGAFAALEAMLENQSVVERDPFEGVDLSEVPREERAVLRSIFDQRKLSQLLARANLDLPRFSLPEAMADIHVPVSLIHGKDDAVTPAWHAAALYQHADPNQTRLCISSLIGHANVTVNLRTIKEMSDIILCLAHFFRSLPPR